MFNDYKSLKYLFDQNELNMRQMRWLELLKDYDFGLNYHRGKADVVVETLSWKTLHLLTLMNCVCKKKTTEKIDFLAKLK